MKKIIFILSLFVVLFLAFLSYSAHTVEAMEPARLHSRGGFPFRSRGRTSSTRVQYATIHPRVHTRGTLGAVIEKTSQKNEATTESEYRLPYPGMLPDSRFYKLKTLRDKLVLLLIRDPYKKAEKHLQLADRMLYESLKVAEKGKIALAAHNAFKGEDHMTRLVDTFKRAVYSGKQFNKTLAERAHKAAVMHKKLLIGMKDRAKTKDEKEQFSTIMEFSQRNDKELLKLEKEATAEPELDLK